MKKSRFILIPVFVSILTFGSCKKANAEGNNQTLAAAGSGTAGTPFNASAYSLESPEYRERSSLQLSTDSANKVSYDSVQQFFTLDYTPEYPDSVFSEAEQNSKASQKKSSRSSSRNGVRKCSSKSE